jgi:hypothetical protein
MGFMWGANDLGKPRAHGQEKQGKLDTIHVVLDVIWGGFTAIFSNGTLRKVRVE